MVAISLLATGMHLGISGSVSAQLTYVWKTVAGVPGQSGSSDSPGPFARFSQPQGMVTDSSGNAYIVDRGNHAVRKLTPQGVVTTLAGAASAGFINGGGASARFSSPSGIARDAAGNLYIADRGNHSIRKILASGEVSTFAGQATPGSDDATGTAAKFNGPGGVAVDGAGNVYVTDTANHTIRFITPGGVVTTLAGQPGTPGTTNGSGPAARFNAPEGIAFHPDGSLLVTETNNHVIRKVTPLGVVTTFAGQIGTPGSGGGTTAAASFRSPAGITVGPDGTVYLSDSDNYTVRRILPNGQVQNLAGMVGTEGSADGVGPAAGFKKAYGVALTPSGELLVTDRDNNTIRQMTTTGLTSLVAGAVGSPGLVDSAASPSKFNFPAGITADASGYLYVADTGNHTIRKVSPAGVVTTLAGDIGVPGSDEGTGAGARFRQPRGLALDPSGNLYAADTGNHTIRKITPQGLVSTVAGVAGMANYFDGVGPNAWFNTPMNLDWLGLYNSLVISDMGNHVIRLLNPTTRAVSTLAGVQGFPGVRTGARQQALFASPCGMTASPNGELFITNFAGESIAKMAGSYDVAIVGGKYLEKGSNDGNYGISRFREPAGIDSDSTFVVISDTTDHTIRLMNSGEPNTVATVGGRAGLSGTADGLGRAARFITPNGVVKAPNGDIYVADSGNHRVVHGKAYANPWTAWQAFHNISSGAQGDDDADGLVNFLEFAFATNPRDGAGGVATGDAGVVTSRGRPSVIRDATGYLGLFPVRLDSNQISLRYTPEFSSDLSDWSPSTGVIISRGTDDEVNLLSVRFPATLPNGKVPRFFRVVVNSL